ncbi:SCO family protein [Gallaecimonas kandeliae]|uniref:SCO family protein n=1 Tax=Gallaecimonas kandeliae TaxID=3029055 RepID=UPI002647FC68|nr:SCO family protein [Gallaecimonas kandeliae]WKE65842.1 SCO family protein [Gallaecimonas kandeliae]
MKVKAMWSLVAALFLCVGLGLYFWLSQPPQVQALWYPQPRPLAPFKLSDQDGKAFTQANLKGKWSLVFLGYTSCPDICPATLSRLSAVYPKLEAESEQPVQVIFLTADPKRDTQARLKDYIRFFGPEFIAVRGGQDQLFPLSRQLGLMYQYDEDGSVGHSADLVLVNPDGAIEAMFRPASGRLPLVDTKQLLSDFEVIADARS